MIQSKEVLSQRISQIENRLHGSIRYRLSTLRHFLASKVGSRGFVVAEAQVRRLSQRVDDLGIGIAHAAGMPAIGSLMRALERTLRPDVVVRAQSIAAAMRRDGAHEAAQSLINRND